MTARLGGNGAASTAQYNHLAKPGSPKWPSGPANCGASSAYS